MRNTMKRMLAMLTVLMVLTTGMASAMTSVEPEVTESTASVEATQPAEQKAEPSESSESHSQSHSTEQTAAGNDSNTSNDSSDPGDSENGSSGNESSDNGSEGASQENIPVSDEIETPVDQAEFEEGIDQEESENLEDVTAEDELTVEMETIAPQNITRVTPTIAMVIVVPDPEPEPECEHPNDITTREYVASTCKTTGSITEMTDCPDCRRHLENTTTLAITENHEHDVVTTTVVAPTCKTAGSVTEMTDCADCGRHLEKVTETAVTEDHEWDDGVVTIEPEIGKAGEMTYTCKICGKTRTEAIPALEAAEDNTAPVIEEIPNPITDSAVSPQAAVETNESAPSSSTQANGAGTAGKARNGRGSIVTNVGWRYLEHNVKEERTEEGEKIFHVIAPAKGDGTFALRYLVLTPDVIGELRREDFMHISYEMDDAVVVVPVASFGSNLATQGVAALDLDIDDVTFVIMLNPEEDTYVAGAFVKEGNELIEFFDLLPSIDLANSERPEEYAGIPYRPFVAIGIDPCSMWICEIA